MSRQVAFLRGINLGAKRRVSMQGLREALEHPFAGVAADPARYQVTFLSAEPPPARAEELERADVAPERVVVRGREVYAWHPDGLARSELAKLITSRRLGVEVTARNWRTVTKLLELADEP